MINFNDLPCDIKNVIFKINKEREKNEYINNKKRHLLVIDELDEYFDEGEEYIHQDANGEYYPTPCVYTDLLGPTEPLITPRINGAYISCNGNWVKTD